MSRERQPAPQVVAAIPGRIRLRWPVARHDVERLSGLAERLERLPTVTGSSVVASSDSVIVRWRPGERRLDAFRHDVERTAASVAARELRAGDTAPGADG